MRGMPNGCPNTSKSLLRHWRKRSPPAPYNAAMKPMKQLNNQQATALLDGLSGWQLSHDSREQQQPDMILKSVRYPTFAEAMRAAQQVAAALAGSESHLGLSVYGFDGHANITVALRTLCPDETKPPFGVTEQDIILARRIEVLLSGTP